MSIPFLPLARRVPLALAALLLAVQAARAEGVLIRLDDRAVRSAGIEAARVEPESGQTEFTLPGTVVVPPGQLTVIAAPAAGLIEALLAVPDEPVTPGQPLARLRSTELIEAQRAYLEAAARENLSRQAQARDEQLFRERIIPERRVLTTRAEAAAARAVLDERTQLLTLYGMSDENLAALRDTRRIAPNLEVRAPAAGVILQRNVAVGERVANAAPLFQVAQLDPLWLSVQVPIARVAALQYASRVAVPGQGAEGRVIRIGRSTDAATQSVTMTAEVTRGAEALRPGQVVGVAISVATNGSPQWRVPAAAVVRQRDRHWVFRRVPEGFLALPVTVLSETAQSVSLSGRGLSAGDSVAVRGMVALLSEFADAAGG